MGPDGKANGELPGEWLCIPLMHGPRRSASSGGDPTTPGGHQAQDSHLRAGSGVEPGAGAEGEGDVRSARDSPITAGDDEPVRGAAGADIHRAGAGQRAAGAAVDRKGLAASSGAECVGRRTHTLEVQRARREHVAAAHRRRTKERKKDYRSRKRGEAATKSGFLHERWEKGSYGRSLPKGRPHIYFFGDWQKVK